MFHFLQFAATRLMLAVITLIMVSFIVFSLMELVPGDCAERYLAFKNTTGAQISVADIEAERKKAMEMLKEAGHEGLTFRYSNRGVAHPGRDDPGQNRRQGKGQQVVQPPCCGPLWQPGFHRPSSAASPD